MAMMQHEFGHILQYRKIGAYAYWHVIAPESLTSAAFSSLWNTENFGQKPGQTICLKDISGGIGWEENTAIQ